jgi:hypothetical protein
MTTKKINVYYWVFLSIFTMGILTSAIPSAVSLPYAVDYFTNTLGYPAYFLPFTGVTKLLGLIAIFIPGYYTLKEWVYAGFVFDLTGALYSKISIGEGATDMIPVFVGFFLLLITYTFHRKRLKVIQEGNRHSKKLAV